jgi:hypothetical protein
VVDAVRRRRRNADARLNTAVPAVRRFIGYDCAVAVTLRVRIWLPFATRGASRQSVREWHNMIFRRQLTA